MRCGDVVYRVYMVKGDIVVRRGRIGESGNFIPFDKPQIWMTKNPTRPMKLEHGKVYCVDEADIPKAIEMVKENHEKYVKETMRRMKRVKNNNDMVPSIDEAIKLMQDGAHKYMTDEYMQAYGMAIKALKIVSDLRYKGCNRGDETIKDAWETLSDEQKDLCYKFMRGEITPEEYSKQSLALEKKEERENNIAYEFKVTEAEFKAIKHGLEYLYRCNSKAICPETNRYFNHYSIDTLHRMKVENAVIGELMEVIGGVENE